MQVGFEWIWLILHHFLGRRVKSWLLKQSPTGKFSNFCCILVLSTTLLHYKLIFIFLTFLDNFRWYLLFYFNVWTLSCSLVFHNSSACFSYFNSLMAACNYSIFYFPSASHVSSLYSLYFSSDVGLFISIDSLGFMGLIPYICSFEGDLLTTSIYANLDTL